MRLNRLKYILFSYHIPIALSVCFFASVFLFSSPHAYAGELSKSEALMLETAERFFIVLKYKNYPAVWNLLTKKSQETIINDILDSSVKKGIEIKKQDIINDFSTSGIIFKSYWDGFLSTFNPDIALNKRVWALGEITEDKAVILLKGKEVTNLEMYRENDSWKVGLVETFWKSGGMNIPSFLYE